MDFWRAVRVSSWQIVVMKTIRLAFLFTLNLLNNLRRVNNILIRHTYTYFRGLINRSIMDQDDEHQQQGGEGERVPLPEYEPLLDIALDEMDAQEEYVAMDVIEDTDNDSDNADDEDDDEDNDDDNGLSLNFDVLEKFDQLWPLAEFELKFASEIARGQSDSDVETFRRLQRAFLKGYRAWSKTRYSFKPLRLIRCRYKTDQNVLQIPMARSGHRIIASDSHLYSLGGYNPDSNPIITRRDACILFQELWAFNFATSSWKLLLDADNSEMPRELASNALAIYNNVLIVSITSVFLLVITIPPPVKYLIYQLRALRNKITLYWFVKIRDRK